MSYMFGSKRRYWVHFTPYPCIFLHVNESPIPAKIHLQPKQVSTRLHHCCKCYLFECLFPVKNLSFYVNNQGQLHFKENPDQQNRLGGNTLKRPEACFDRVQFLPFWP